METDQLLQHLEIHQNKTTMSINTSDPNNEYHVCHIHHESPQSEMLIQSLSTSERMNQNLWRKVFLVVKATNKLIFHFADKAKHQPQAISEIFNTTPECASCTAQPFDDAAGVASHYSPISGQLEIHLTIPNEPPITNTASPNHDASAATESQNQPSPTELDNHANVQNDNTSNTEEGNPLSNRISAERLSSIVKGKNLVALKQLGGVEGIAERLNSKVEYGISNDVQELEWRQSEYSSNIYGNTPNPSETFLHSVYRYFKNWQFFLLLCAAVLSLASGIIEEGPRKGWYEGTTVFIFISIVIVVSSIRIYWYDFRSKKHMNKSTPEIKVLRDGQEQKIPEFDVLVGDIVSLKTNDRVPADGLFLKGNDFEVNDNKDDTTIDCVENPFLFFGTNVIKGDAHMLITSVGKNTAWDGMMRTVSHDPNKKTLLQARIENLVTKILICRLIQEIFILLVLLLRFSLGKLDDETGYPELKGKGSSVGELIMSMEKFITNPRGFRILKLPILLAGIQEGLPFLITLALPYWRERIHRNQGIVQKSWAAVTMGSITTICTDETASLTLNKLEVNMFWIAEEVLCDDRVSGLPQEVLETIQDAAGIPVLATDAAQTDNPIVAWGALKLGLNMDDLKQRLTVLYAQTSSLGNKRCGYLIRKNGDAKKKIHVHWSGDAETVLAMCSDYYDSNGIMRVMDEPKRAQFKQVTEEVSMKGLQSIAFAYKVVEHDENDNDCATKLEKDGLILIGLMSLKNLCRQKTIKEGTAFQCAGVGIKLVSPESLSVLTNLAIECGILKPEQDLSEVAIHGEYFRNLPEQLRMEMVEKISVIASALPSDKLLFVQCLQKKGHVVALTGSTTFDTPSLIEADVGLLMGPKHSETARESADMVILNGGLDSMFNLMLIGRSAYRNIQNFIQFVLVIEISGPLIATIATVSMGDSPLTDLQLFWVSMMLETLAAFALLTEAPTTEVMEMPAVSQTGQLITKCMRRSILTQVLYQVVVLLIIQFNGQALPGLGLVNYSSTKNAFIFNSFVLCQVFNQLNARMTQMKYVLQGIRGNYWLLTAAAVPTLFQVIMTELVPCFADTARLNWVQWLGSILIASLSLLLGFIVSY